jgi:hypothetical protein
VADVKTFKDEAKARDEKASPASGVFGFAGTTLFQPGQKLFKGDSNIPLITPEKKGDARD